MEGRRELWRTHRGPVLQQSSSVHCSWIIIASATLSVIIANDTARKQCLLDPDVAERYGRTRVRLNAYESRGGTVDLGDTALPIRVVENRR